MKDDVLNLIIRCAIGMENSERDISGALKITICVGGRLISGSIISHKMYMSLLDDGRIQDIIDKAKQSGSLSVEHEVDNNPSEYLHLASAKFIFDVHDIGPTDGPGVLWRGRLDRIDGFHVGEFKSEQRIQ